MFEKIWTWMKSHPVLSIVIVIVLVGLVYTLVTTSGGEVPSGAS